MRTVTRDTTPTQVPTADVQRTVSDPTLCPVCNHTTPEHGAGDNHPRGPKGLSVHTQTLATMRAQDDGVLVGSSASHWWVHR